MKKLIFTILGTALLFVFTLIASSLQASSSDPVLIGSASQNNGPGQMVECMNVGQKKMCMAENMYNCTESEECF